MLLLAVLVLVSAAAAPLRRDGVAVVKDATLRSQFARLAAVSYPFKPFSDAAVARAKADPVDWTTRGAVTPAKDQGNHGYCGTFGRVAAAEGQFALRTQHPLANFSEQELISCIGWDREQFPYFQAKGFVSAETFPYNFSGADADPPIPGQPCEYDAAKVIPGTVRAFTNSTGPAPSEDQMVAFVNKNGPVQTGIYSDVFALREKGCEARGDCFITAAMCAQVKGKDIDHSITLVGYGTDEVHGDYWVVKSASARRAQWDGRVRARAASPPPRSHPAPRHDSSARLVVDGLCQQRLYQRVAGRRVRAARLLPEHVHDRRPRELLRLRRCKRFRQ
jgi:hypothetical protein